MNGVELYSWPLMKLPLFNVAKTARCTCLPKHNINPYLGRCAHGCVYCYAVKFPSFRGPTTPRLNLIEDIVKMVKSTKKKLPVMLSDCTDPYQPMEEECKITRRCIEVLAENGFPLLIVTKSDLVTRDIDIFRLTPTVVSMTITTPRKNIAELIEPDAPPPSRRFSALERVSEENRGFFQSLEKAHVGLSKTLRRAYADGEWISGYKYLERKRRLGILEEVRSITLSCGLEFATCREGFPELNTTICDGTAYCRGLLIDNYLG